MTFREITIKDVPAIFDVRVATNENNFTYEELEARGITYKLLEDKLLNSCKGWLCEINNETIAFVIADKKTADIWALAVLPTPRKKQISANLRNLAEHWLFSIGRKSFRNAQSSNRKINTHAVAVA